MGDLTVAPFSVTAYFDKFCSLVDARLFAAMPRNSDKLDFIDVRYGGRHDTTLGAWK